MTSGPVSSSPLPLLARTLKGQEVNGSLCYHVETFVVCRDVDLQSDGPPHQTVTPPPIQMSSLLETLVLLASIVCPHLRGSSSLFIKFEVKNFDAPFFFHKLSFCSSQHKKTQNKGSSGSVPSFWQNGSNEAVELPGTPRVGR